MTISPDDKKMKSQLIHFPESTPPPTRGRTRGPRRSWADIVSQKIFMIFLTYRLFPLTWGIV
jgi:hypothetical protein